jgi:hypothetical protein
MCVASANPGPAEVPAFLDGTDSDAGLGRPTAQWSAVSLDKPDRALDANRFHARRVPASTRAAARRGARISWGQDREGGSLRISSGDVHLARLATFRRKNEAVWSDGC